MRQLKGLLKATGILLCLLLVLFSGFAIYLNANKDALIRYVKKQINEDISGTLSIGQIKASLIKGFPNVAIQLQDVILRDSLWARHHHDLLKAHYINVSVNALSILSGTPRISDITIANGFVHVFTDTAGYSNTSALNRGNDTAAKPYTNKYKINKLSLSDVALVIEHETKHKYFHFNIHKMTTQWDFTRLGWDARLNLSVGVESMSFNTSKGSFLSNRNIATKLNLSYNTTNKTLSVPTRKIRIDGSVFAVGAIFDLKSEPGTFVFTIDGEDVNFRNAVAMLTPAISSKVSIIDFTKPVTFRAILQGRTRYLDTPEVFVTCNIKNNTLVTPAGTIANCSFVGMYSNYRVVGGAHTDVNALIGLKNLKATWSDFTVHADTVTITNLLKPYIDGKFTSRFGLSKLNKLIGPNTFVFNKGTVNVVVSYKGGIDTANTTKPFIAARMQLKDAGLTYVPAKISFTNTNATIRLSDNDLLIEDVNTQRGNMVLNMKGDMLNFRNLFFNHPEKIKLNWSIRSKDVDLNELIAFLPNRKSDSTGVKQNENNTHSVSGRLDRIFTEGGLQLHLDLEHLFFRSFSARQLQGTINLNGRNVILKDVSFQHADGTMKLDGHIWQHGNQNNYKLTSAVAHANVRKFLTAFENFNQDVIMDRNISGDLSATFDLTGALMNSGKPIPGSVHGAVAVKLTNGALDDFEPLRRISKFVFRKRNLDHIVFHEIENKFVIQGNKILIEPFFIESSAVNMHIGGIYAFDNSGTDIDIDIPLRNPSKDDLVENDVIRYKRNMKGIVIHLKASADEDGKLALKWNLRKKATVGHTTLE